MSQPRCYPFRFSPWVLLGLTAVACTNTDGTNLSQPAGSGGEAGARASSGGSAGLDGSGGGSAGLDGSGGASEPPDAGLDASSDASRPTNSCVVGSLAAYCAINAEGCPASYAAARARLQDSRWGSPRLILQEACSAPDGSPRIRVSADLLSLSLSYIYDPGTGQLVSVFLYDDLGGCSAPEPIEHDRFGQIGGFYGEALPGCAFRYDDYTVPPACVLPAGWHNLDAGTLRAALIDAGLDAGSFDEGGVYECVVAP